MLMLTLYTEDVETAFLRGPYYTPEEDLMAGCQYMTPPYSDAYGFTKDIILKLKKALYGCVDAAHRWRLKLFLLFN